MQAVILAGGLGTRLRPITQTIPKSMVPICGQPFLKYQLEVLSRRGVERVVICLGYLGQVIEDYFGDGRQFGLSIRYGTEGNRLLGTAGAIKNAEDILDDVFFVVNGDLFPILDFPRVMDYFVGHDRLGLMVVFKNEDRWDRSDVIVDGSFVRLYNKHQKLPGMVYIDFGVSVFRRQAFAHLPRGAVADLTAVYHPLIQRQQLLAYETAHRFYEVGSLEGLREFETLVRSGPISTVTADKGSQQFV